jgi:hypothetical protein
MQKWEYRTARLYLREEKMGMMNKRYIWGIDLPSGEFSILEVFLEQMGANGWELVTGVVLGQQTGGTNSDRWDNPSYTLFFKRPL